MRAIVSDGRTRLQRRRPDPSRVKGEAVIRVHRAGICATDLEIARGYMAFSGVLGHEFVGTVVAGSRRWRGKRVVGEINCICGRCEMCIRGLSQHCRKRTVIGIDGHDGCFADLVAVPEQNLHEVPASLSDQEAVFTEPLAAAYQVIKQCPIETRERVTVLGSGRLGLLVVQVLASTGCKLDVVGRNAKTLEFCEKKGIQATPVADLAPKADRDVVVDCTGSPDGFELAMRLARPRGTIVLKSTYAKPAKLNLAPAVVNEITVLGSRCGPFSDALSALARKQIDVLSMISREFELDRGLEAVQAAADPSNIKVLLKVNP